MDIPLGCFSRPWAAFEFDETLAGIAAAGFDHFGFLGLSHDQPSLDDDGSAIPEGKLPSSRPWRGTASPRPSS